MSALLKGFVDWRLDRNEAKCLAEVRKRRIQGYSSNPPKVDYKAEYLEILIIVLIANALALGALAFVLLAIYLIIRKAVRR